MGKYLFGTMVLLKLFFTSAAKQKKKPALRVDDLEDKDIIVCKITSKWYATEFHFAINKLEKCGLSLPSVVRLHKITTLEKN